MSVHLSPGGTLVAINSLCSVIFLVFSFMWIYMNVMTLEEKKIQITGKIPTTWGDHMEFSDWLMRYKNPKVVVELGVDFGFSTCCFALYGLGVISKDIGMLTEIRNKFGGSLDSRY